MRVRSTKLGALALATAVMLFGVVSIAHADGKKVFLDNKCNKCHDGSAIGAPKLPSAAEASEEDAGPKVDAPAFPDMKAKLKGKLGGDLAKFTAFLKKEGANSDGKKHKKSFMLGDADYKALFDLLQ